MSDKKTIPEQSDAESQNDTVLDASQDKPNATREPSNALPSSSTDVSFDQPELDDITVTGKPRRQSKRGTIGVWLLALLMLILLGGTAGGGYWMWQQQQLLEKQQTQLATDLGNTSATLVAGTNALSKKQLSLTEQWQQQEHTVVELAETVEQQQLALQSISTQLLALTSTTNDDWKLAEAHYLTRLAGQRLLMERDAESALALLLAADEIISHRSDPALYDIRKQLADDIASLKLADDFDREGLFLSLSAIGNIVNILPKPFPENFSVVQSIKSELPADIATEDDSSWWEKIQTSFFQSLSGLKGFVRITHSDETLDDILSPQAQSQLHTSLRLNIENAQWALLREETLVYQESLQRVDELLKRYYPLSDQAKQLSEQIAELKNRNIVQQIPDISGSTQVLGRYLEKIHKLGGATTEQLPTENKVNQSTNESENDSTQGELP
ncbi:uroporphyrinogen-III C-methyltransferase [Aurantivibrio plasticivorans]